MDRTVFSEVECPPHRNNISQVVAAKTGEIADIQGLKIRVEPEQLAPHKIGGGSKIKSSPIDRQLARRGAATARVNINQPWQDLAIWDAEQLMALLKGGGISIKIQLTPMVLDIFNILNTAHLADHFRGRIQRVKRPVHTGVAVVGAAEIQPSIGID